MKTHTNIPASKKKSVKKCGHLRKVPSNSKTKNRWFQYHYLIDLHFYFLKNLQHFLKITLCSYFLVGSSLLWHVFVSDHPITNINFGIIHSLDFIHPLPLLSYKVLMAVFGIEMKLRPRIVVFEAMF